MPALTVKNYNSNFGGTLINQKYSPVDGITIVDGDKDFYAGLFKRRIDTFARANLFPRQLSLFTSAAWPEVDEDTPPPMVVISSGRAEWVSSLFKNAKNKNNDEAFTGYNDASSFGFGVVPWYAPLRSGRPVYIVVHYTEYTYYKNLLRTYKNVYVVGWRIPPYRRGGYAPTGFGASRFAALELVKTLGYQKAWAVDDNVVNINGFPNTPEEIEGYMDDKIVGIGFSAATKNKVLAEVYATSAFPAKDIDVGSQKEGLLQQVVLWNLKLLVSKNLSFSPYFVTSNEDVSLTNLLQASSCVEKVIKNLTIVKMQPDADSAKNAGVAQLATMRKKLYELLYEAEGTTQISSDGAKPVNLSTFVTKSILPNSQNKDGDPLVAQSMTIEQALAKAALNANWPPKNIFNPYNGFDGAGVQLQSGALD